MKANIVPHLTRSIDDLEERISHFPPTERELLELKFNHRSSNAL